MIGFNKGKTRSDQNLQAHIIVDRTLSKTRIQLTCVILHYSRQREILGYMHTHRRQP